MICLFSPVSPVQLNSAGYFGRPVAKKQPLTPKQLKKVLSEPTHSEITAADMRPKKKSPTDDTTNLNA